MKCNQGKKQTDFNYFYSRTKTPAYTELGTAQPKLVLNTFFILILTYILLVLSMAPNINNIGKIAFLAISQNSNYLWVLHFSKQCQLFGLALILWLLVRWCPRRSNATPAIYY